MGHRQARDGGLQDQSASGSILVLTGEARGGAAVALGRPPRTWLPHARRDCGLGPTAIHRIEKFTDRAGVVRRAPALGKSQHLEHAHRAVERDSHHIAGPHRLARGIDALAVDPYVSRGGERGRRRARPHHPRVPEPFIDALAVQGVYLSNALSRTARGPSPGRPVNTIA